MELISHKWPEDLFQKEREKILSIWPTGEEVDLIDAVKYHKAMPRNKNMPHVYKQAKTNRMKLVSPRTGTPVIEDMIDTLLFMEKEGCSGLHAFFVDTYTRRNDFQRAKQGLEESIKTGEPKLNGFPISIYGVEKVRRILEMVHRPVKSVSIGMDQRFTNEIALAGGCTQVAGGPFAYTLLFGQHTTLEKNIPVQQYTSRLVGWYEDHGVPIVMMHSGTNTGSLVYPAMAITLGIVETLISAQQGCRNILHNSRPNLSLAQDVAMSRLFMSMTEEYLRQFGFRDVEVFQYCGQWSGSYPRDEAQAFATVCVGAAMAAYSEAVQTTVKTYDEGVGMPTQEVTVACCRATKQILNILQNQRFSSPELEEEIEMLSLEVRALMDNILEMGKGDVIQGTVQAFKAGRLEFPFSPHRQNAGKVLLVRDAEGAVRLLDAGNLPLPDKVLKYHRKKVEEREKLEQKKLGYDAVVDSIMFLEKAL
jgi:methylaspartate mutase epsilon subunit